MIQCFSFLNRADALVRDQRRCFFVFRCCRFLSFFAWLLFARVGVDVCVLSVVCCVWGAFRPSLLLLLLLLSLLFGDGLGNGDVAGGCAS